MTSCNKPVLTDVLELDKIDNLQQVCGVFGYVGTSRVRLKVAEESGAYQREWGGGVTPPSP